MKKFLLQHKKACIIAAAGLLLLALILLFVFVFLPLIQNGKGKNEFEIQSIEIWLDGKSVGGKLDKEFIEDDFKFDVVINNNDYQKEDKLEISWSIVSGNNLSCAVEQDGTFAIGDTLGSLKVQVSAASKNTLSQEVTINIIAPPAFSLQAIEAVLPQNGVRLIEGQTIELSGVKALASFLKEGKDIATVYITSFDYDKNVKMTLATSETVISYRHFEIERMASVPIIVKPKTLQAIEITNAPAAVEYIEGQFFNSDGLEVTAHYEYIHETVTDYIIGNAGVALLPSTKEVVITYLSNGVSKTAALPISVAGRTLQNIQIVSPPSKTKYVQGQIFQKAGLKILACYEYFDRDITDEIKVSSNGKLFQRDEEITFSYLENGVLKSLKIPIEVKKPYEAVRRIEFENALDATLSWVYRYTADDGTDRIDNTELSEHDNLLYDNVRGIYVVPVGAIVTIRRVNPAVVDFKIDGKLWGLQYPSESANFELDFGEPLKVEFSKVPGEKITVRFLGDRTEQSWVFIYPLNWNLPMRESDLVQVSNIYEDSEAYFYEYIVGGNRYTFAQLSNFSVSDSVLVQVERVQRTDGNIISIEVVYERSSMMAAIDKNAHLDLTLLPRVEKVGYALGFSTEKNGRDMSRQEFELWIQTARSGDRIYAVYTLNAAAQTGPIVGLWKAEIAGTKTLTLAVLFQADGTYSYTVTIDNQINCKFTGIYTFDHDVVTILSAESNLDYQLVSAADFEITLSNQLLNVTLFLIDGLNVSSGQATLNKV